jgi:hypothetical protein
METNMGVQVDGRLQSLIEAAERGERCPDIYILVGSWIIQGLPVSTDQFMRITYSDYHRQVSETKEAQKVRNQQERDQLISQHVSPLIGAFGLGSRQDGLALSVANAAVSGSTGPVLHVPALRIPVTAVQSWWSASFSVDQNRGYSGGVGVGFAF